MKYNRKNQIIFILTIGVLSSIAYSCTKTTIQFGSQFADNQYTQIIQIDTIQPALSTVFIDSFITSNTNTGLVGAYQDPAFGKIEATSYFQLSNPSYNATSTQYDHSTYDSLTLYIKMKKGSYYGDTTKPIQINVYELSEKITPPNNGSSLYNTSVFANKPTPLGSITSIISPNNDYGNDTLAIRLDDAFGRDLLTRLQNNDISIQSLDQFISYFSGIKLTAGPNSQLAIGINDSIEMRLYYKTPAFPEAIEHYATFGITSGSLQFNNITINRTGALLDAGIGRTNTEISSKQTDSSGFLLPLASTFLKMTFPSITSLLQTNGYIQIANATLFVRPVKGTFEGIYQLPPALILSQTDLNDGIGTALTSSSGTTQTGQLQIDYLNQEGLGTYYSYDLTSYLRALITDRSAISLKKGLLITPPVDSLYSAFNRIVVGDANNTNARLELRVQYISVK